LFTLFGSFLVAAMGPIGTVMNLFDSLAAYHDFRAASGAHSPDFCAERWVFHGSWSLVLCVVRL
jgi:hypothetical protein